MQYQQNYLHKLIKTGPFCSVTPCPVKNTENSKQKFQVLPEMQHYHIGPEFKTEHIELIAS